MLQHPDLTQLNQRITLRWHIGPLGRREAAAYLNHRIDVASGEPGRRLFSRPALRLIHRYARGVPRLLNMLAHRSLLAAYAAERQREHDRVDAAIAACVCAVDSTCCTDAWSAACAARLSTGAAAPPDL